MPLDSLIEIFDKRVVLYGNHIERSVLEQLRRLKYLEALVCKKDEEIDELRNKKMQVIISNSQTK